MVGFLALPWESADAKDSPKVAIFPFTINGPDEIGYLAQEIPRVLSLSLEQEGAEIITSDKNVTDIDGYPDDINALRSYGIDIRADFVIFGSLTRVADKFSIDATVINVKEKAPPIENYVEGHGIENLLGTVKSLADKLQVAIFQQQVIAQVLIKGTKRIEPDAIERIIKTKPGDIFSSKALSDDLKAIYGMGYFEDIRIESTDGDKGKVVTFHVEEKPTIRKIKLKGNKIFNDEKIRENLNISTGSILNIFRINSNIKAIENLYKEKNYQQVKVTYEVEALANNQADILINIEEGKKIRIKKITFQGNTAFDSETLKKIMKTSEKGFFSWLTSSGELNKENLEQDVSKLSFFYQNHGYIQARVADPIIEYKDIWIYITIKIEEGPQYKVGKIDIEGDLIFPKAKLMEAVKIRQEKFYNLEVVRNDLLLITDMYKDEGYAYAQVFPKIDEDPKNLIVNITFNIDKRKQVYFERISIGGNTNTRDKVIRRELKVHEGELYSNKDLNFGLRNLYRLNFFEDLKVNTPKGSSDDQIMLDIDVVEKSTGAFSFGAGYSSVEDLFVMASIAENNLFGRGQTLELKGTLGSVTENYTLSFVEPWLFDIPLTTGFDLYNTTRDYYSGGEEIYTKESFGFKVTGGYPVFDYTRFYLSYNYDVGDIEITADEEDEEENISDSVWKMQGQNVTQSVRSVLRYDSRDKSFNATEGSSHSVSVEYAGFGGDIGFTKYLAETGWYFPIVWKTVGFLHSEIGYVTENAEGILPEYERFFLGGANSLRGFGYRDVGPVGLNRYDEEVYIGGDKYLQFNFEYLIPLVEKAGLMGVFFYDTGNAWSENGSIDLSDLRESAGVGVRWFSPLGPIRLEWGHVLDPKSSDTRSNKWEFSMGSAF
ncbi:MAG: outer membrane protein assembly factor BamA [Desulfobacteraceae bacterium]